MGAKQPVVTPLGGSTSAAGNLTLKTKPGEPGQLLCIQLVSVVNDSTDGCLADVGIERSGLQIPLETLTLTTHAHTYNFYHIIWIPSDWQVYVKFSSGGNDIHCSANVLGYLTTPPA